LELRWLLSKLWLRVSNGRFGARRKWRRIKMLNYIRRIQSVNVKTRWIGWFVTVHLTLSFSILILLMAVGINPTLLVSALGAPLWIGVAFGSKTITDKIMED